MPKQRKRDGVYWRKDRGMYWLSFVDATGKRVRKPGAQSWEDAKRVLAEATLHEKNKASLKPGEVLPCEDSFADVADRFLAYQKPRITAKSYEREASIVAHLKEFFAGPLAGIGSAQVSDYVTLRLGKVSKSSVRKELNSLKHLFRLVCGEWKMLPRHANPTVDVQSPEVHDERTRYLTPAEFKAVLEASPAWLRPIVGLATATGMRRSELLGCRWVDVVGNYIMLPDSKNGDPRPVCLNSFARQVIGSLPAGKMTDRLFPGVTPEQVSMAFHRVCEDAEIQDFRFHDLRHTHATWLRQGGTDLDVIADQLGHRDLRMTKRYAKIANAQVWQAVNRLDSILEAAQTGEQTGFLVSDKPASLTARPINH